MYILLQYFTAWSFYSSYCVMWNVDIVVTCH